MINLIGDYFGCSGYSSHTRQLGRAINKIHPIKIMAPCPNEMIKYIGDDELTMLKNKEGDINLIITMPIYWKMYVDNKRNWAFLVFEGDKIPKSWIDECLNPNIEYIFVPSEHTKQAITNTTNNQEILNKIKVIPHGVDDKIFYPVETKKDKFTFLINKGWRNNEDRGGTQYAVKAFLEEFNIKDNVQLIIKINQAYGIPDINKLINELKPKGKTDFAPITIITDNVPYEQLGNLYNQCDVFLSPTRAEAFNLGCIEAMACGKPVITTNFGGQSEYVNNDNGWIIGGELKEVTRETMYEGIKWLNPDIEELKEAMRSSLDTNKGISALIKSRNYTWNNSAKLVSDLI